MSKETVIVQLSAQDRTLLRRIADALDPVTAPQSGPRRLRDKHVALTAEDSKRIAEDSV